MLPLRDNIPSARFPLVTLTIILINVVVFPWELSLGRHINEAFMRLAIVPLRYTDPEVARMFGVTEQLVPLVASMFLHGGWVHLIGNMWKLGFSATTSKTGWDMADSCCFISAVELSRHCFTFSP